ncbi:GNAT family N-acetyltransferase [Salipaludibacillus aurantiacus]|uniref:Acetyltransferase (GNAT) family protein n=1 Tax=Salipaludibacillus aurantiacus TaxID=1601833 RepID=A0A1H9NVQ9_9BACI|nr:GNAT family N-acetyltransferase [Salipaludibacillus aurantiacus]SER40124.1 Acetyltransferase (GNAT) family protein [Salipaludibacillus aurantiacus]
MQIRKASVDDAKGIARVNVDCWKSAYKHVLPSHIINKLTYSDREERWKKNLPDSTSGGTMTFVAEDQNGEIIGFALGGTMRDPRLRIKYTGELYALYVSPEFQGRGIGRKLFDSVIHHLSSLRHSSVALWVFEDLHSCTFYTHLGGEQIYHKKTTVGGKTLNELAFGWQGLDEQTENDNRLN